MKRMDFVQAVVRIRVLEKKLLTRETLMAMVETSTLEELWHALQTTVYREVFRKRDDLNRYEKLLKEELIKSYRIVEEISPVPDIVILPALKFVYHNLKVFCKEMISKTDLSHLYVPIGSFRREQLEGLSIENSSEEREEEITAEQTAGLVLAEYDKTKDPKRIDILLDRLYMEELYEKTVSADMPLILEYVRDWIDLMNIRTLIRVQEQGYDTAFLDEVIFNNGNIDAERLTACFRDSPSVIMQKFRNERIGSALNRGFESGERMGIGFAWERELDNYLIELLRQAKYIHFGPEPLIAYLIAKETEIKNLRILILAKQHDLPKDQVLQRMRDVYA